MLYREVTAREPSPALFVASVALLSLVAAFLFAAGFFALAGA